MKESVKNLDRAQKEDPLRNGSIPFSASPPSFELEAEEPEFESQTGEEPNHKKIERKFRRMISHGKPEAAIRYFFDAYGFDGVDYSVRIVTWKKIKDSISEWAWIHGEYEPGAMQTICVRPELFKKDFGFIARCLSHEFHHMLDSSSDDPIIDDNEQEFRAYYFELFQKTIPEYGRLEDRINTIQTAIGYYKELDRNKKEKYKDQFNEIQEEWARVDQKLHQN